MELERKEGRSIESTERVKGRKNLSDCGCFPNKTRPRERRDGGMKRRVKSMSHAER